MSAPLSKEVALRIGLAAKAFQCIDPRSLLKVLIRIMGEPITEAKLEKLRARRLMNTAGEELENIDRADFDRGFAFLKGRGVQKVLNPAPDFPSGVFCEIKGSLRVACASDSGENIDGKFATCTRFLIYQVSENYIRLIDIREPSSKLKKEERYQFRANLLKDCALLYTTAIGALAAAKTVKVGLHPIHLKQSPSAQEELIKLQKVLARDNPPPWLCKAMGKPTLGVKLYGETIS